MKDNKKHYDFGDGYKATTERTSSGYIIVVMDTPAGKWETMHSNEQKAMAEILSYFED